MIDSVQSYPCAERLTLVEQVHGCTVADPYRWLEDASASEHWLRDQDDLWLTYAASLTGRFRWKNRVRQLSDVSSVSTPVWRGGRCFTLRRETGQQYAVLYVDETPLLDPKQLDPSGLTTLDAWQPSPDGTKLAYQLSSGGDERSSLHVLDVLTGEPIDGPIDGCRYSPVAWLPDNETFYYVRFRQVRRHRLGDPDDATILSDEASYGLEISADGRWLTICTTTDVWLADLTTDAPPRHLPQETTTIMSVGPDGRLYVVTTQGIYVGDPTDPTVWHDYLRPNAPLTGLAVLDDVVLVSTATEIAVHDRPTGRRLRTLELPGHGSIGSLTAHGNRAWFTYTDSVTPPTVCCYDASTEQTTRLAGSQDLETHQLTTSAGVELRVIGKPGPRPTILYGYGGFGQALTPTYSAFALAWVEAGGSFVTATLPTRDNKQDTVDDFIAAAEYLIAEGWTTADQLAVCGESNGGLLTAAALTQRPELFSAAVCSAPLTDMLRYELSGLGDRWTAEYGSVTNPDDFKTLASYSPYHRVSEGVKYPAVLLTAFGNDTRVDPLHARKLCAALQHATASSRPVLLRFEPDAGHTTGGINLAADILAFVANETGLIR
ncbi:prolyl oligopeptidase family serine peptidase [Kribbella sp. NBC_00482]|uniref:prolyl oligopeptidase family serine peptidase n=1 Tax=Kribbella sp. NBC_00482 TaxID=2975968 RepID=UPI002E18D392